MIVQFLLVGIKWQRALRFMQKLAHFTVESRNEGQPRLPFPLFSIIFFFATFQHLLNPVTVSSDCCKLGPTLSVKIKTNVSLCKGQKRTFQQQNMPTVVWRLEEECLQICLLLPTWEILHNSNVMCRGVALASFWSWYGQRDSPNGWDACVYTGRTHLYGLVYLYVRWLLGGDRCRMGAATAYVSAAARQQGRPSKRQGTPARR